MHASLKPGLIILLALAVVACSSGGASNESLQGAVQASEEEKLLILASAIHTSEVIITDIDYEDRRMTLFSHLYGDSYSTIVFPLVENFEALKEGQRIEIDGRASIIVKPTSDQPLSDSTVISLEQRIGVLGVEEDITLIARVIALDYPARKVTVEFLYGESEELFIEHIAGDPESLKVGDTVEVIFTVHVTLAVRQ